MEAMPGIIIRDISIGPAMKKLRLGKKKKGRREEVRSSWS